ncbi:uncharacterized protein SPPG_02175 [Spizellomyces punctatus DAOM BR117]|nr:uncharacterized protein SPPG_02175 [Spizellomyces punctatus DAOM BR117]KND03114.1 hypothetical protein SPPG_02175 [Spizellomyces punctatus DAOM BR117]|eukprot:XP_016611153.1 hypothetical protein SPPG_02175 [Spizellomyces punctatus DAOM BR117]
MTDGSFSMESERSASHMRADKRPGVLDPLKMRSTKHRTSYSSASSSSSTTSSVEHHLHESAETDAGGECDFGESMLPSCISPALYPAEHYTSLTTLNRSLTQSVLRFDQLTTSYINLRNQLRNILDSVEEQERQYEAYIEEIGQLRFERKFLREVVELSSFRERKQSNASDKSINSTGANKRWSSPMNTDNGDGWGKNARRWTVGGAHSLGACGAFHSLPTSPRLSITSSTFLPHVDDENRVTVDDLASRKIQREAFAAMLQTIRETFLVGAGFASTIGPFQGLEVDSDETDRSSCRSPCSSPGTPVTLLNPSVPSSPSHIRPTPLPSYPSNEKHVETIHARISHLTNLIGQLAPSVEALRESLEDVIAGPALAYRAWVREAEIEREMLRVECEGLREAREGSKKVVDMRGVSEASVGLISSALESLWVEQGDDDHEEWESESVYWSCDEGDDER